MGTKRKKKGRKPKVVVSNVPSFIPSLRTSTPSSSPSIQPSSKPSMQPSSKPSMQPSSKPSISLQPSLSLQPSSKPSLQPSLSMQPSAPPVTVNIQQSLETSNSNPLNNEQKKAYASSIASSTQRSLPVDVEVTCDVTNVIVTPNLQQYTQKVLSMLKYITRKLSRQELLKIIDNLP